MKKELFLSISVLVLGLIFSVSNIALALSEDIKYPVKELGNCQDEKECRTYCDKPENMDTCVAFAKKNKLITDGDAKIAENFLTAENKPGNCENQKDCETYCNDVSRIDECVAFAEKNNMMSADELKEAKKIQGALKQGAKMPGGCRNKDQCDAYCESSNHMEECINFSVENGMMQGKELEEAQKMLQAVKKGIRPPPCKNKKDCDNYCGKENHFEECISFSEAAGFMSKEEAMMVRKTGGKGPGDCKGKEECDTFCQSSEENMMVCAEFALKNGMMTQKDFEMMKKTGGKGPGNCKGKEECDTFCQNPDNQETCFQFGRDNGMIPEEELKRMGEGKQEFKKSFENMPQEVADCISQKVGSEMFAKFKNGAIMPSRDIGESMRECFEKMGPPGGMNQPCEGENCPPPQEGQGMFDRARGFINQMMPGNNQNSGQPASVRVSINKESSGLYLLEIKAPNGIKEFSFTSEGSNPYSGGLSGCPKDYSNRTMVSFPIKAAITDCKDEVHEFTIQNEGDTKSGGNDQRTQEEMQPGKINMGPNTAGPGGCKSQQECEEFCKNNPDTCKNFMPAGEQRPCEGNNCPPLDKANQQPPQEKQGIFNKAKNFIRQFAPGTEGRMPGKPCEGENCPPPGGMNQPCEGENCRQQMAPGTDSKLQTPQFQGRDVRIPSPEEIQQMQGRMMREGVRQYIKEGSDDNAPRIIQEGMEIREGQDLRPLQTPQEGFMPGTGGSGPMMPNSGGNYIAPPQGQMPPGGQMPPQGQTGPGPGTAPPGNIITPPTDGSGAPPPSDQSAPLPPTSFNSFQNLLVGLVSDLLYK